MIRILYFYGEHCPQCAAAKGPFEAESYGSGSGSGSGSGYGMKMIDGYNVHKIDNIQTIILSVHRNYAKGYILEKDLTLQPCYIAKCGDFFAHGSTLKDAVRDAKAKYDEHRPLEERIDDFVKEFPTLDRTGTGQQFYDWHHILTGSCVFGRNEFCKAHGVSMDERYAVRYFLDITKDDFGGDAIRQLRERYKKND